MITFRMPTHKCDRATQTGADLVQRSDSETQTGSTLQLGTSATSAVTLARTGMDSGVQIVSFCTPFEPDNFRWFEKGRSMQTSPTWGMISKVTQTPSSKNAEKMMRPRLANKKLKAKKRRTSDDTECQGRTYTHTHPEA